MRGRTKIILGSGLALVAFSVTAGVIKSRGNDVVEARIEEAALRDLTAIVTGSGWIRPNRRVDVQADIMGRITELRVEEGASVRRGDVLLRIDPTEYEGAVDRARAAVSESRARHAQARANLIQATREMDRLHALAAAGQNMVTRQSVEEAETAVEVQTELARAAGYGVEQAEAALGEAQDRLAKTVIRAPMDGVISRLNVEEGETAIIGTMNNAGSLLLTVADLSTMEAVVRIDETDVPHVTLGDSAAVQIDAFPKQTFTGRVTKIAHSSVRPPETQTTTGQSQAVDFEVVITLDAPPADLRSDLSASADIVTDRRMGVLAVPIIALTVRERGEIESLPQEDPSAAAAAERVAGADDVEGVFVVREGVAHFTPVQIGINGREHFEVLTGLSPGDSVVSGPYEIVRTLVHEARVRQIRDDTTKRALTIGTGR